MRPRVVKIVAFILILAVAYTIFGSGRVLSTRRRAADTLVSFLAWGESDRLHNFRQLIDAFEESQDRIRIKMIPTVHGGGVTSGKLEIAIASRTAADVIEQHYLGFPQFADLGAFLDLQPYIDRDNYDLSDFFKVGLDAYRYQGRLYGLPLWGTGFALYYNKDLFDEFGYPYPDDTWTFEDFMAANEFFTRDIDGDGKYDIYGADPYEFTNWLWSNGGEFVADDGTISNLDSPANIETLRFFERIIPHAVPAGEVRVGFDSGKVAMQVAGPWKLATWDEEEYFELRVAPFPKGKAGRKCRYSGVGVCIWEGTESPDEAWEFVKFLCSPEGLKIVQPGDDIPSRKSLAYSSNFIRKGTPWREEVFIDALLGETRVMPPLVELPKISKAIMGALDDVHFGDRDMADALKGAAERVNQIAKEREERLAREKAAAR